MNKDKVELLQEKINKLQDTFQEKEAAILQAKLDFMICKENQTIKKGK